MTILSENSSHNLKIRIDNLPPKLPTSVIDYRRFLKESSQQVRKSLNFFTHDFTTNLYFSNVRLTVPYGRFKQGKVRIQNVQMTKFCAHM